MVPKRLGQILLDAGKITESQLDEAVTVQAGSGRLLGEVLVDLGFISDEDVARCLAQQLELPFFKLDEFFRIGPEEVRLVPEAVARKFCLIPAKGVDDKSITVIMSDPVDIEAVDAVRSISNRDVYKAVGVEWEIVAMIDKFYREEAHIERNLQDLVDEESAITIDPVEEGGIDHDELRTIANDAPVVRFVNLLLMQAVRDRASDIHFEPGEEDVAVRIRVDGKLREVTPPPKALYRGVVTRIKILSDMDIAERRLPLDGRFKFNAQGRSVDVRVSSLPEVHGEKLVLRILDRDALIVDLDSIGFEEDLLASFKRILRLPNGIILLTGPTGSGKTTTLYSALTHLKDPSVNVQTVEDPVEYLVDSINQMQIRPQIGLDFANSLRHILRQDPDVIMIGEIRDEETARIAMRAALTGHLVLSTLHTNDAPAAFSRLTDVGIEPYLIAATIRLIIAQRLVRVICDECKEQYQPNEAEFAVTTRVNEDSRDWSYHHGVGCHRCGQSGYLGRRPVFEFLEVTDDVRNMVLSEISEVEFRQKCVTMGMETLLVNGLRKVKIGLTTLDEVFSVSPDVGGV